MYGTIRERAVFIPLQFSQLPFAVVGTLTADRYNKEIPEYWAFKQLLFNDLKFENLDE